MKADITPFDIKKLPYTARFGLGSTEPIKRWARFELRKSEDLYWFCAHNLRKDCDSTNAHISVHRTGEIYSSRYIIIEREEVKIYSSLIGDIGGLFSGITEPYTITSNNENLEPGYLYSGLRKLIVKDRKTNTQNQFIPCLDDKLVNSKLYSCLDLVPWTEENEIANYLINKQDHVFEGNNPRCHVFIFRWGNVSAVVSMKFTNGDSPIDLQKVAEADRNAKPLKRLFHHETLSLSELVSLKANPTKRL